MDFVSGRASTLASPSPTSPHKEKEHGPSPQELAAATKQTIREKLVPHFLLPSSLTLSIFHLYTTLPLIHNLITFSLQKDQAWLIDYDDLYFIDILGKGTSSVGMFYPLSVGTVR